MEVFVLMGEIRYEGDALLGVYASEEEAVNAQGVYTRDGDQGFDSYFIIRQTLGAPADSDITYRIDL